MELNTRTEGGKLRKVKYKMVKIYALSKKKIKILKRIAHEVNYIDGDKETFVTCRNKESAKWVAKSWNARIEN